MLSADDVSLLQLFVLIRAATERVSEERLLAEVERRNIRGFTATALRGLVSSLVHKGLIRLVNGDELAFVATGQGQKAAEEARTQLSNLLALLDD